MRGPATDEVLVLDFGGQYSQLIARRVRECGVFSELLPHDVAIEEVTRRAPKGLILSGGPASVYADGAPALRQELLELGIPVLGICYGMQAMVLDARRPGGGRRGRRVRALPAHGRRARPAARRGPGGAELLDEPPRHRLRGPAGLHRAGVLHRVAGGGDGGPGPRPLRDPVPPRGGAHPLRHPDPRDLPARHRRLRHVLERRLGGRGAGGPDPRAGGRRQGDLRAVRRRGLVGGRAAHLQGGRATSSPACSWTTA